MTSSGVSGVSELERKNGVNDTKWQTPHSRRTLSAFLIIVDGYLLTVSYHYSLDYAASLTSSSAISVSLIMWQILSRVLT